MATDGTCETERSETSMAAPLRASVKTYYLRQVDLEEVQPQS